MQEFQSHVSFTCPVCCEPSSGYVAVPEPDWGAAESSNDLSSEGQIYLQSTGCEHGFDAHLVNNAGWIHIDIPEHPKVRVLADMAHYSPEWLEPEVPSDPRSIFEELQGEVRSLLRERGDTYGGSLFNRMLFAALISGLEAFLSDTLINAVSEREEAQLALVSKDKDVLTKKFSLPEIIKNPDLVIEEITSHLREISFHNLPKVNALYSAALNINFFAMIGKDNVEALNKAIVLRHHVVHRNGRDKEGKLLEVFTPSYVATVHALITNLVTLLDEAVNPVGQDNLDDLPF